MAGFVQDPMRMPTLGSNDQLARTTINHGSVLSGAPNAAQRRPPHPMLAKMYPQLMPATPEGAQKKKQISFPGGPGLLNKQGEGPAVYPADLSINFLDSKTLARLNPLKRALIGGVIGTGLGYGVGALGSPFLFNSEQDEEKKKEQRSGVRTISAMLGGLLGTAGSLAHFNYKHPSLINSVQPSAAPFSARTSVSLETPGKHFGRWYDKIPGGFKRVVEKAKEVSNTNRAAGSDVSGFAKRWPEMPYKNLNDPTRVNWHAMPKDVSIFERQTSGQTKGRGFPVDLFSYPSSPTSRATLEHELTHNVFPGATDSSRRDGWLKDYVDTFRDYLLSPSEIDVRLAEIKRRFAFATGELVDTPEKAKKAIEWWKARNNQYRVDAFLDKGTNAASIGSDWEDVYERLPERFKQELYKRMPELVQNEGKRMGKTVQASATSYGPNGVIYKPGEGPVTSKVPISSPIKGSPQLPQPMSPQGNQAPGSVATRGMAPPMPTSMPMGKVACVPGLWTLCKQSQNPLAKGENIVLTETESTGDAPSMQSITFYPFEPSKYASVLRSAASGEVRPKWKPAPDARNSAVNLSDVARKTKVDSVLPPAGSSGFLFKKAEGLSPLSEQDIPQGNPAMRAPWMNGPASTYWANGGAQPELPYTGDDFEAYSQLTPENREVLDSARQRNQIFADSPMANAVPEDAGWATGSFGPDKTPQDMLQFQQKYPLGLTGSFLQSQRGLDEPNLMDRTRAQADRLTSGVAGTIGGAASLGLSAIPAGIGWAAQKANKYIGDPLTESLAVGAQNLAGNAWDTTKGGLSDVVNSFRPSQVGGPSQMHQALEDARAEGLGAVPDPSRPTGYTRPSRMPDKFDQFADSASRLGEFAATNAPGFVAPLSVGLGMTAGDTLSAALGNQYRRELPLFDPRGAQPNVGGYENHGDIYRSLGMVRPPVTSVRDIPEYQEYLANKGKSPATQAPMAGPGAEMINDYAMKPAPPSGESMINDYAMQPGPQAPGNPAAQAPVMPVSAQMPQAPQQPVGPPEWASRFQPQIERAQRAGNMGEVRRLERMQAQAPQLVGPSRPDYTKWNDPQFVNDWKARQGGGPVSPSQAPQVQQPREMFAQAPMPGVRKPDPTQNVAGPMSAPMPQMAGVRKPDPSQDVMGAPGAMTYPNGKPYQYGYGSDGRIMEPVAAYMQDTQMRSKAGLPEQDARTAMTPEYSQAWNKAMAQPNPAMSAPQGPSAGSASGDPRGKMMQQTSGTFSPPGAGQYQRAMPNMNVAADPKIMQQTRGTFSPPGSGGNQMAMPNIRQQTRGTFSPPAQAKVPTPTGNLRPASVGAPKSPFQMKMSWDKQAVSLGGLWRGAKGLVTGVGRGAAKAAPTVLDDAVRGGAGAADDGMKTLLQTRPLASPPRVPGARLPAHGPAADPSAMPWRNVSPAASAPVVKPPMAGAQGAFGAGAGRAGDMLGRGAKATAKALAPYGPTAAGGAVGLGLINHGVGQYRGMLNESMGQGRELMNEGLTAGRQFKDELKAEGQKMLGDLRAEGQKMMGGAPDIQTAISQGMQNGMPSLAMGQSPVGQGFMQMLQGGGFWPFLSSLFSTGKQNLQKDYSTIADKIKQPQSPALSAPVPEDQSAELAPWLAQLLNQREDDSNANFWAQNNQQPAVGSTLSNASDRLG